jgi:uracil-DNA glycosylase
MNKTENEWDAILANEYNKKYYMNLQDFLKEEYEKHTIFPPKDDILNALKFCDYGDVKVVILGQDPYHEKGQSNGLAFSVCDGIKRPPSLNNIFKELFSDIGIEISKGNSLENWAKQGVLLLNVVLTVREGEANSHKGKGWETFTDEIIKQLNLREKPIVFILWGAHARLKKAFITNKSHLVLESPHPSPLSAYNGFWGSKPFSKANNFLSKYNECIDWRIKL